jgi:hypothetical protein
MLKKGGRKLYCEGTYGFSGTFPWQRALVIMLCFIFSGQKMKSALGWTTPDWGSPIHASNLSKEILTNPELGLNVTGVCNWTER